MKKVLLLSVGLLAAAATYADIQTHISDISAIDGKYIRISRRNGNNGRITVNGDNLTTSTTSASYWFVQKIEDKYIFRDVITSKYINRNPGADHTVWTLTDTEADAGRFTITSPVNTDLTLKAFSCPTKVDGTEETSNSHCINADSDTGNVVRWAGLSANANSHWYIDVYDIADIAEPIVSDYVNTMALYLDVNSDEAKAAKTAEILEAIKSESNPLAKARELINNAVKTRFVHADVTDRHPYVDGINTHTAGWNLQIRYTPAVRLADNLGSAVYDLVTNQQSESNKGTVYQDLLDSETMFETLAGATVTLSPQNTRQAGNMQKAVFVDWNGNNTFDPAEDGYFDGTTLKSGVELVTFDIANVGGTWIDRNGTATTARGTFSTPVSFVIPEGTPKGVYYARYKVDWNNITAQGNLDAVPQLQDDGTVAQNNAIGNNGGIIIDFKFRVTDATELAKEYAAKWVTKINALELIPLTDKPTVDNLIEGLDASLTNKADITAAIDAKVSDIIEKRLEGHFVTIQNLQSGWYLHSNCAKITLKDNMYARSLWRVLPAKGDNPAPFTFVLRSVFNLGYMKFDTSATADRRISLTADEAEATNITLRPFGPGAIRDHFYISGPEGLVENVLHQSRYQAEGKFHPSHFMMSFGNNDDGSVWVINMVDDARVKKDLLPAYLSRYADSADDSESLNKIKPTQAIIDARAALDSNFSVASLMEMLKLEDAGINMPRPGRYYRFALSPVNKLQNSITEGEYHISTLNVDVEGAQSAKVVPAEAGGNDPSTIFYLSTDNKLVGYNGYYVNGGHAFHSIDNIADNTDGATVTIQRAAGISALERNAYNIILGENLHTHVNAPKDAYGYRNGDIHTDGGTNVCGADHNFYVEEVKQLPVEIHSADNCGTVYLPVTVTVPAGYTAYIASLETDGGVHQLKLTESTDGIIPAYTGAVIRRNDDNTATTPCIVTIDYTKAGAPAGDLTVRGDIVAAQPEENDNLFIKSADASASTPAMVLADASGATFNGPHATFKKAIGTTAVVPANSMCFLGSSDCPDTIPVPLNADGADETFYLDLKTGKTTNGITSIAVSKADGTTVIYDLQGRRLNKTAKGINIINGRKVLVK